MGSYKPKHKNWEENRSWPESQVWDEQDAQSSLCGLLDASHAEGPQLVKRQGVEEGVVVPIEQWRKMEIVFGQYIRDKVGDFDIKEWLLRPEGRGEMNIPPRFTGMRRVSLRSSISWCTSSIRTSSRNSRRARGRRTGLSGLPLRWLSGVPQDQVFLPAAVLDR